MYYHDDMAGFEEGLLAGTEAGFIAVFVLIYFLVIFISMAFSLVSYVLQSLGMYTIAERRGIKHGWLAWVPFGNLWILGSISDQYQYIAKGQIRNRRKVMLGLGIGVVLLYLVLMFSLLMSLIMSEGVGSGAGMAVLISVIGLIGIIAAAVASVVLQYMSYYDLFNSCQPSNAVLYLVLSIIFGVTLPFFVFACRKKDLGMPPRKQPAVQQAPVPAENTQEPEALAEPEVTEEPEEGFAKPEEFEEE